jgi:hypothetical protein
MRLRWQKISKKDFEQAKTDLRAAGATICNENTNPLFGHWMSAELDIIPSETMLAARYLWSAPLPGNPDIDSN